jgi:hypothetical protein
LCGVVRQLVETEQQILCCFLDIPVASSIVAPCRDRPQASSSIGDAVAKSISQSVR